MERLIYECEVRIWQLEWGIVGWLSILGLAQVLGGELG